MQRWSQSRAGAPSLADLLQAEKTLGNHVYCGAMSVRPEWSASLDEDGSLMISSENLFELAAIVHGYSLDSVLINDAKPKPIDDSR